MTSAGVNDLKQLEDAISVVAITLLHCDNGTCVLLPFQGRNIACKYHYGIYKRGCSL